MDATCETCRFWKREDDVASPRMSKDVGDGECRRFPPVIIDAVVRRELASLDKQHPGDAANECEAIHSCFSSYHPWTLDHHWCGEHQPREVDHDAK